MNNIQFSKENIEKLTKLKKSNFFSTFELDDKEEYELSDLIRVVEIAFENEIEDFAKDIDYTINYFENECVVELNNYSFSLSYEEIESLDIELEIPCF